MNEAEPELNSPNRRMESWRPLQCHDADDAVITCILFIIIIFLKPTTSCGGVLVGDPTSWDSSDQSAFLCRTDTHLHVHVTLIIPLSRFAGG